MRLLLLVILLLVPVSQQEAAWTTLTRGEEKIEIYRDEWGIPHIFAPSVDAAFWAQGWTEVEDRFWFCDYLNRKPCNFGFDR